MSNTAFGTATYSIRFKETEREKIDALIAFVKSLDFVQSVEVPPKKGVPKKSNGKTVHPEGFLAVDEIRRLYPNEWVLLGNPVSEGGALLGGTVILHDPEKQGMALRGKGLIGNYDRATHFFASEMPKSLFGAWDDAEPADTLVERIRGSRNFTRQIEAL